MRIKLRILIALALLSCLCFVAGASSPTHSGWTKTNWIPPGKKSVYAETEWPGEYHYSRARLGPDGMYGDSGRCWGWNLTSASCSGTGPGAIAATGYTNYGN